MANFDARSSTGQPEMNWRCFPTARRKYETQGIKKVHGGPHPFLGMVPCSCILHPQEGQLVWFFSENIPFP